MDLEESFDSALMGAFTDDGTPETSAPEITETALSTEADTGTPEAHPEAPVDEDDLRSFLEQTKAANPEQAAVIDRIHREMQGAFTPKLQAAAELRKQFEGVTPELAAWSRQMNELAATDPARAAEALRAEAERLCGFQQAAPEMEEPEFVTDAERLLWEKTQQQDRLLQQIVAERNERVVNQEFSALEEKLGAKIPYEERYRVVAAMSRDHAPPETVGRYWKDFYFDRALQMARDQAAGVVQRKAGMAPPPSSVANRAGDAPPPPPKNFEEAIRQEFQSRGIL